MAQVNFRKGHVYSTTETCQNLGVVNEAMLSKHLLGQVIFLLREVMECLNCCLHLYVISFLFLWAANALWRLHVCTVSSEGSLLAYAIRTKISRGTSKFVL